MPTLAQHQSNEFTKMLLMGDPSSGKTGAHISLVKAGYHLRILDMDNGLDILKQLVLKECPEKIDDVEYRTLRDKYKSSPAGPTTSGTPKAFLEANKMLDRWKYDDRDLGEPAAWGADCVLVIDSLTLYSDAAFNWAVGINPFAKDPRQWFGAAQAAVQKELAYITSPDFQTNVIVISHVSWQDNPDGTRKGYPNAIGAKLSPIIPRYFNSVALCQTKAGGRRTIQTAATSMIDLKNPKPFEMKEELELETGLADFFATLRTQPKPKLMIRK